MGNALQVSKGDESCQPSTTETVASSWPRNVHLPSEMGFGATQSPREVDIATAFALSHGSIWIEGALGSVVLSSAGSHHFIDTLVAGRGAADPFHSYVRLFCGLPLFVSR